MADKQRCQTHGYVDPVEMHSYGGVLVHMVEPWHVALNGDAIEMKDATDPVLDGHGRVVVITDIPEPPADAAEEAQEPGVDDG